ncbi:MAG: hypothetical protein WCW03_00260 [Candidatus Paceibacterota bacterium]
MTINLRRAVPCSPHGWFTLLRLVTSGKVQIVNDQIVTSSGKSTNFWSKPVTRNKPESLESRVQRGRQCLPPEDRG